MGSAQLFPAFHFAFMFWFGLSAGCFVLLLIHHAIRGAWALPIQRVLEAGTRNLIVMGVLFVTSRRHQEPFAQVVTPRLTRDMGNLTLTCTMLWAYFTFSQYVIVWSGNLPEETSYFHTRLMPSWNILGMIVVLAQFFAPFL